MKTIGLLFLLIATPILGMAQNSIHCDALFGGDEYKMFMDVFSDEGVDVEFPAQLFTQEQAILGEFSPVDCKDAMLEHTTTINGNIYKAIITMDDRCDGGNSYGLVLHNGIVVALITDSDFICK